MKEAQVFPKKTLMQNLMIQQATFPIMVMTVRYSSSNKKIQAVIFSFMIVRLFSPSSSFQRQKQFCLPTYTSIVQEMACQPFFPPKVRFFAEKSKSATVKKKKKKCYCSLLLFMHRLTIHNSRSKSK